jgi:hypothetical protein
MLIHSIGRDRRILLPNDNKYVASPHLAAELKVFGVILRKPLMFAV